MKPTPQEVNDRIGAIQSALSQHSLDAYLIPRTDEFQSEYTAPYAERIAWLTGFTGSQGYLCVTRNDSTLYVDGRYVTQVKLETQNTCISTKFMKPFKLLESLSHLQLDTVRVGFCSRLFTTVFLQSLAKAYPKWSITFVPLEEDLVDTMWDSKPVKTYHPLISLNDCPASEEVAKRLEHLQKVLIQYNASSLLVTDLTTLAWIFDWRGSDIPFVPVFFGAALFIAGHEPILWIGSHDKHTLTLIRSTCSVRVENLETLYEDIIRWINPSSRVLIDQKTVSVALENTLRSTGAELLSEENPCSLMQASKTEQEINSLKRAYTEDSWIFIQLLHWISTQPTRAMSEMKIIARLDELRQSHPDYLDDAFSSIVGIGPHSAIIHYRPDPLNEQEYDQNALVLIDCGAHFTYGTTDQTRTIPLEKTTQEQRYAYTRVLKGHLRLSRSSFPEGTTGRHLDALARYDLWCQSQDYAHGTGHGVGYRLSVHEGPQGITPTNDVPLTKNMLLSNEPGFYLEGHYGIRIENILRVVKKPSSTGGKVFLGFETLTYIPYDYRLIATELLNDEELTQIDTYHNEVFARFEKRCTADQRHWLEQYTRPIEELVCSAP